MAISRLSDRIRNAITAAARNLPLSASPDDTHRALPMPGDLYVFDTGNDIAIEWLVVRAHPDDPNLILLAPIDDFHLTGTPDLTLPTERVGRSMTVRCGQTDWFPQSLLTQRLRVGTLSEDMVVLVKRRLADLARGRILLSESPAADFDPEYENQIEAVAQARVALLARSEWYPPESPQVIPFKTLDKTLPHTLICPPEFSLAAEDGGALFTDLGQEIASPDDDVRYLDLSDISGGRLILVIDPSGVRGIWEGPQNIAPVLRSRSVSGEVLSTAWHQGPQGRLSRTVSGFPWIDGRVTLFIGTDPPRAMAVEL